MRQSPIMLVNIIQIITHPYLIRNRIVWLYCVLTIINGGPTWWIIVYIYIYPVFSVHKYDITSCMVQFMHSNVHIRSTPVTLALLNMSTCPCFIISFKCWLEFNYPEYHCKDGYWFLVFEYSLMTTTEYSNICFWIWGIYYEPIKLWCLIIYTIEN